MASWLDLLSGNITPLDFYTRHVPFGDELIEGGDLNLPDRMQMPSDYLELFTDRRGRGWETAPIRESPAYRKFEPRLELSDIMLFAAAVKQSCAVEVPGPDRFAFEPYNGFYSRLMDRPHTQVAGTKNRFYFLQGIFTFDGSPSDRCYRLFPKDGMSHSDFALLESLFLYRRTLPGVWLPSQVPSWPASDDLTFTGYLAPAEVQALSEIIENFNSAADEEDDDLFPLLVDRVQRAAGAELGLITIHGGL